MKTIEYLAIREAIKDIDFDTLIYGEWSDNEDPSSVCLVAKLSGCNMNPNQTEEKKRAIVIRNVVRKYGGNMEFWMSLVSRFDTSEVDCSVDSDNSKQEVITWLNGFEAGDK